MSEDARTPQRRQAWSKPDKRGRSGGRQRKKNPPTRPSDCGADHWAWQPLDLVASPVWSALSINARRVLDRLMVEQVAQGGVANGELCVSYDQFVEAGCSRRLVSTAIAELEAAGVLAVRRRGRIAGENLPNLYRLTWLGGRDANGEIIGPSHEWKGRTAEHVQRALRRIQRDKQRRQADRAAAEAENVTLLRARRI